MPGYVFHKPVTINGIKFDSEMEGEFYKLLLERKAKGEVREIVCHPSYVLFNSYTRWDGKEIKPITYEPDFRYFDVKMNRHVCVDVKGMVEPEFALKRKIYDRFSSSERQGFYPHLYVLKHSKTTGWVDIDDYKKIMREKKLQIAREKKEYKQLSEFQSEYIALSKIPVDSLTKSQIRRIKFLEGKINGSKDCVPDHRG